MPVLYPPRPTHPTIANQTSPHYAETLTDAVRLLAIYCEAHAKPLLAAELQREHVQAFIADQLARWKPATAHNRYRGTCRIDGSGATGP